MTRQNRSRWYEQAMQVIEPLLPEIRPELGLREARRYLNDHYPFGPREYWPYKMWCRAVTNALSGIFRSKRVTTREYGSPLIRVHPRVGVICGWCKLAGLKHGCLACCGLRERFDRVPHSVRARWLDWIKKARKESVEVGILADWLQDEAAMPEEAVAMRTSGLLPAKYDRKEAPPA